jgi:large subunit ribosomal protein L37Ae
LKTKKRGAAATFGSRYGKSVTSRFRAVAETRKKRWPCPSCLKEKVRRESAGVWYCPSCGQRFAGKAYKPK